MSKNMIRTVRDVFTTIGVAVDASVAYRHLSRRRMAGAEGMDLLSGIGQR
ncbi:hypothetical protein [Rhizobium rhizosphaerae]|nr:hypothetical protein [Xaviernesmea rhizosphaerae]